MPENNKRIGRRAIIGGSALALNAITLVYIIEKFLAVPELMPIGMQFFGTFSASIFGVVAFIVGGLSATDIFVKK